MVLRGVSIPSSLTYIHQCDLLVHALVHMCHKRTKEKNLHLPKIFSYTTYLLKPPLQPLLVVAKVFFLRLPNFLTVKTFATMLFPSSEREVDRISLQSPTNLK